MATAYPVAATQASTAVGPIEAADRIHVVDILRGFALFGILLVNMASFKANAIFAPPSVDAAPIDRLASALILFFAEAKFYTLFSFLFGFGFSIWLARASTRGESSLGRFARRLGILLVFGLLHAVLLWNGDILVSYALFGFVLMLFRNRSPRALARWAIALLAIGALLTLLALGGLLWAQNLPAAAAPLREAEQQALTIARQQQATDFVVYSQGSYAQILGARLATLPFSYLFTLFGFPSIFAMFLLGLYAGKRGLLSDPQAHLAFWRRMLVWGLGIGLVASGLIVYGYNQLGLFGGYYVRFLNFYLAGPLQSLGYVSAIVLLWQRPTGRRILAPLAAPGRMALSNYLGQTLICTTLFYGYGFGLFGQLGAAAGIALTIVIFALQVVLSNLWLKRFRFGPMEWLWRTLTYGRAQPMQPATATK